MQTPHDTPYSNQQIDHPTIIGPDELAGAGATQQISSGLELALALLTWFASVILLLLVPPLISLPYLVYRYQGGSLKRDVLIADKTFIFFNILGVIPAHIITFAIAWAVVTRFGKLPFWQTLGWSWHPHFRFWRSVGVAIALLLVAVFVLSRFGGETTEMEKIIMSSRLNALTTAFLATFTAPLVEEVIYRGVLYSALQRVIGVGGAVFIVMSLFALVHGPQYWPNFGVLFTILLLSFSLTLIRARTQRLLPCFVIHLVFNGVQSVFIIAGPYVPDVDRILHRIFQRPPSSSLILSHVFGLFY